MKLINKTASTVGELVDLLLNAPTDYSVSLTGMNDFALLIDDENKAILLDDPKFVDEYYEEHNQKGE